MHVNPPYLMFLGDVADQLAAKTAHGIVDWRGDWCLGQLRLDGCKADLGIPDMTIAEALAKGVKTLIIGVANAGGVLPDLRDDVLDLLGLGVDLQRLVPGCLTGHAMVLHQHIEQVLRLVAQVLAVPRQREFLAPALQPAADVSGHRIHLTH